MKINKEKHIKAKGIIIKLPNKVRLAIIGILVIILLFSVISLANAYQKPTITQIEVSKLEYEQVGYYNYIAYLNENIIYEDKETLGPGEGTIFRNIIKNIDASFIYTLMTNKNSEISGSYTITAQITTELWNKTYIIVSDTPINSNGTTVIVTEKFQIDYVFYENITSQIEEKTGITVDDPKLIFQANIIIFLNKDGEKIYDTLSPTLSVTLGQSTIDIKEGSENRDSGEGIPIIEEVANKDVIDERNTWKVYSLIFLVLLILLVALTKSGEDLTKTGRINKKIMKKYKEWIVNINKKPKRVLTDMIKLNSIEDLMKISEELGKPVFHYSTDEDNHNYYVLDESITYQYSISSILLEKNKK